MIPFHSTVFLAIIHIMAAGMLNNLFVCFIWIEFDSSRLESRIHVSLIEKGLT